MSRVFLVVLDSFGIGYMEDAGDFGDVGANTLASCRKSKYLHIPTMEKMGLLQIDGVSQEAETSCEVSCKNTIGAYGRMTEASAGKDTTIGHWEIAGVISQSPLPTYPNGFPKEVLDEFTRLTGRGILCNQPYSGTEVIQAYGDEHVKTGKLIVYTSADSVFQIAAHEEIVPVETLYEYCKIARKILVGEHGVGRVIARPFIGSSGHYVRTPKRHDFSLLPPKKTMLDSLKEAKKDTIAVGKIRDIFAGQGISEFVFTSGNEEGIEKLLEYQRKEFDGLCFVNLVDFDMLYGHRNNVGGYAKALSYFDDKLKKFIENMKESDIIMITADHGCDPGFLKSTDHSREYTPLLVYGKQIKSVNLGTRKTFADISATILDYFGIKNNGDGSSLLKFLV